uniref:LRRNT domain-containing protein n=1 Tax=Stegastes partitus TaxID=144197 RepID=A0A3B5BJB4_9TELE
MSYITATGKTLAVNEATLTFPLPPFLLRFRDRNRDATMGLLRFSGLVLIIPALVPQLSLACPSGCRCYSLTVECGSLGIKEIPQGQLLELALNGNLIHLVTPDMFRGLEHLRILYLAGNQITRVQDHTFRGLQVGWRVGWKGLMHSLI